MLNYKFWLFAGWLVLGILNLRENEITKLQYFLAWIVVITWMAINWLESVGY